MQNEGLKQIRCKEDEIEAQIQTAKREAAERVDQTMVENERFVKQTEKALADQRKVAAEQVENEARAKSEALLAQAMAEAEEVRHKAAANREAAVALVVKAILCPM